MTEPTAHEREIAQHELDIAIALCKRFDGGNFTREQFVAEMAIALATARMKATEAERERCAKLMAGYPRYTKLGNGWREITNADRAAHIRAGEEAKPNDTP